MDEKWLHLSHPVFVKPALWVEFVAIVAEDGGVSVEDPGVDAENGLCILLELTA